MKYPAGLSGEEYAAMEDGYEQGREAGREAMRVELEKAGWVSPEEYVAGIAGAVAGTLDGLAAHLRARAKRADAEDDEHLYADGMRAAAVEVELWPVIRDQERHWRQGSE